MSIMQKEHLDIFKLLPGKLKVLSFGLVFTSVIMMVLYLQFPTSFKSSAQLAPGPGTNVGSCLSKACTSDTDCHTSCGSKTICADAAGSFCVPIFCDQSTGAPFCNAGAGGGGVPPKPTKPPLPTSPVGGGSSVISSMNFNPPAFTPPKVMVCLESFTCTGSVKSYNGVDLASMLAGSNASSASPYPNGLFTCFDALSDADYNNFKLLAKTAGDNYCAKLAPPALPTGTSGGSCKLSNSCGSKNLGDANCDGVVTIADFEILRREISLPSPSCSADFNTDGKVDLIDYSIWYRTIQGIR